MPDTVHIKGLSALEKFLDQLPAKLAKNVIRGGLRAGAKVVQQQAVANVPVKSGELRKSLKIGTRARGLSVTASVKTKLFYARFVEFGTNAHLIAGRLGGSLFFGGIFSKSVVHPGAKSRPFIRPALDGRAQAAVVAMGNYIKARIQSKHGLDTSHVKIEGDE